MDPIKISVQRGDSEKMELTIPGDSSLDEYEHIIRLILKWLTFADESIDDLFGHEEE